MPLPDDRNILKLGPLQHSGQVEITPAMVESVRQRIKEAGGTFTVWAVLNEDFYETQFGDGFYLHAHGLPGTQPRRAVLQQDQTLPPYRHALRKARFQLPRHAQARSCPPLAWAL
jgi:hypothetical protein